jgi:hypothetical protein
MNLQAKIKDCHSRTQGPSLDVYFEPEDAESRGWAHGFTLRLVLDDRIYVATLANTRSHPRRWNLHVLATGTDGEILNLRDWLLTKGLSDGDTVELAEEGTDLFRWPTAGL